MYRKFSIPVGVAMLAALALVGMLGIFAFNAAQPAQADGIGSATVSVGDSMTGAMTDYTFSVTTNAALAEDTFINLDPPMGYTVAGGVFDGSVDGTIAPVSARAGGAYNVALPNAVNSGATVMIVIPGLMNPATAGTYTWMVDSGLGSAAPVSAMVTIEDGGNGGNGGTAPMPGDYSVSARPVDPGEPAQITLKFMNPTDLDIDQFITFVVEDDMGVPSSINPSTVSITGMGTEDDSLQTAPPNGVIVEEDTDAETYEITVFIGDMSTAADEATEDGLAAGAVTVVFRQNAGFTNRTEGGDDTWEFFTATTSTKTEIGSYDVPFLVELSSYKDGRGEEIIAFAYGFKNGTTVRFWRDQDGDGVIQPNEPTLCDATASGDDIAECTFTLANPPFVGGKGTMDGERGVNYVNAVDGRGNTGTKSRLHMLDLEPSITITPKQGAPGDSINVQILDLEEADRIAWIRLSRRDALCGSKDEDSADADDCASFFDTGSNRAGANGVLSFSFEIPSSAGAGGRAISPGIQDLRVDTVGGKDANTNITIATGELQLSSNNVLPNQRVSISASGFTRSSNNPGDLAAWFGLKRPDSLESDDHGCPGQTSQGSVTLGGQPIDLRRVNEGDGIEVTSGGTWSAPLDLPVNRTTTVAGTYELRIKDCRGGIATVDLTFPQREVTLSPEEGGVGSEVVISGKNFPVENDSSKISKAYEVQVVYDADAEEEEDDVDPNTVGSFTIILEVPEDATIPSNNTVSVEFTDDNGAPVLETFTHRIPQGSISFDRNTGPENSVLTVEAKGFARYTSMDKVEFGDRDILPIPKPSTDTNGDGEFQIRIPGADPGIYIIRVEIADVVATHTFTVTEGGGAEDAAVETVLGNIMSEDALDRVFRFDNTTKMWEWYISDPAFASTNNLAGLSSGDLVYIKVTKDVTANILGASTTLTCTNAGTDTEDCWNLIAIP